jgi:hypothetical protein
LVAADLGAVDLYRLPAQLQRALIVVPVLELFGQAEQQADVARLARLLGQQLA